MEAKKVWIYASSREFNEQEVSLIENNASAFLSTWKSHGSNVPGEIKVYLNQFIVVLAGNCGDSMCGRAQDAQANFIKTLDEALQVGLMDRMQVQYIEENFVQSVGLSEFKTLISNGNVTSETIVFNNTITSGNQFPSEWQVRVSDSWHSQLI